MSPTKGKRKREKDSEPFTKDNLGELGVLMAVISQKGVERSNVQDLQTEVQVPT